MAQKPRSGRPRRFNCSQPVPCSPKEPSRERWLDISNNPKPKDSASRIELTPPSLLPNPSRVAVSVIFPGVIVERNRHPIDAALGIEVEIVHGSACTPLLESRRARWLDPPAEIHPRLIRGTPPPLRIQTTSTSNNATSEPLAIKPVGRQDVRRQLQLLRFTLAVSISSRTNVMVASLADSGNLARLELDVREGINISIRGRAQFTGGFIVHKKAPRCRNGSPPRTPSSSCSSDTSNAR